MAELVLEARSPNAEDCVSLFYYCIDLLMYSTTSNPLRESHVESPGFTYGCPSKKTNF